MTDRWAMNQATPGPSADKELQQRLLAMPAANDAAHDSGPGFFSFFTAWRERRFATACCRELLRLHHDIVASHPGLTGEALYRAIVMSHVGADERVAESLLQRAQESYALWPEPRVLCFRDVAHYLAVSGYWALHHGRRWICSDIRRVIESSIPRQL
jgi:hypothetical protein